MKKIDKIKSSFLSRGLSLTKLTVGAGSQVLGHALTTMLADAERKDAKWRKLVASQALSLSKELGELKGSLMKAGQMLSMYGELFLPAEANEFLKTLQASSPALAYPAIEKVLLRELGTEKMALLDIDPESIGSASLGQVHKARIKATGEDIAIKVQYPNVDKAIDTDLRAIRTLLSVMNLLPTPLQTDLLFSEVREMLEQEVDYRREAEQTETYRRFFDDNPALVVPKVYREFSSNHVLATSFEEGLALNDPTILGLSQERRNRLAELFLTVYFREIFTTGIVQTDPHLGNYRVRLDPGGRDQLVLLDFGAVRQYPDDFMNAYRKMVSAALIADLSQLEHAAVHLGFLGPNDPEPLKRLFYEFCLMTVEPFLDPRDPRRRKDLMNDEGLYDWRKSDLPKRLSQKLFAILRGYPLRTPPRELIFLDRKTAGVFVTMNVLGAKIRARELILKYSGSR